MSKFCGFLQRGTIAAFFSVAACSVNSASEIESDSKNYPYWSVEEIRAEYTTKDSRFMDIHGMKVHYMDEGEGPALLMVHGSESSLHTWDVIADMLKDEFRIIRYDIPGFGLSDPSLDPERLSITPEDLAAELLHRLGVKKVTGVGVSSGGTLVTYLAAAYPELVERLVLSNMPSAPVKTDHLVMPQTFLDAQQRAKQAEGFEDEDYWYQFHTYFAGDPDRISKKILKEYYDYARRFPEEFPHGMVGIIGDGIEAKKKFSKVTQPVFIIWGSADPLLPRSAGENLEAFLPNADVSRVFLKDVGHYPPLESPIRFGKLMEAYLKTESKPE
jgi:pimeloyl-ACP methyl ester carboxylesterase